MQNVGWYVLYRPLELSKCQSVYCTQGIRDIYYSREKKQLPVI